MIIKSSITLPVSYHGGHSGDFCDHASGTKEELLEAYIRAGFTHVGIVEHMPPYEDRFLYDDELILGHNSSFLRTRFERYFQEVKPILHESAKGHIHLLVGLETEYYGEQPLEQIRKVVCSVQPDFVVASVHHVDSIPIDYSPELYHTAVLKAGGLDNLFAKYYDHQFDLIANLSKILGKNCPVIVGHLDLVKIFAPEFKPSSWLKERIVRNIRTAISERFIFEVNARAYKKGFPEPYPSGELLALIQKYGGKITVGDDAHAPEQVGLYFDRLSSFLSNRIKEIVVFERSGTLVQEITLSVE